MTDYQFELTGSWAGAWDGQGMIRTEGLQSKISVAAAMAGRNIGTNPDELLTAALASCYMITLGIRLKKEAIAYERIEIHSETVVTKKGGLHVEKVTHQPTVFLSGPLNEALEEQLHACIRRAEQDCMIAKAVKGNVAVSVRPRFIAGQ